MRAPSANDDALAGDQPAQGTKGDAKAEQRDCAASDDARRKRFEDLRARLALAVGYALHELADGTFLVTRWDRARPLPDLRAVAEFVRLVGGAR